MFINKIYDVTILYKCYCLAFDFPTINFKIVC